MDQNHVASNQAGGICTALRVGLAVEHNRPVTVCGVPKNLMEVNRKAIEVTNVVRAKIRMESIVEQGILHCEIDRAASLAAGSAGMGSTFAGRLGLLQREGKGSSRIRRGIVGGKIETIYDGWLSISSIQNKNTGLPSRWPRTGNQNNSTRTLNVFNDLAAASTVSSHDDWKCRL